MTMNNLTVNLDDLVCDCFSGLFTEIVNAEIDRAVLNGGRNSTKSQVISEAIVTGVMNYKESAVCMVKHANKISDDLTYNDYEEFFCYFYFLCSICYVICQQSYIFCKEH